MLLVVGDTSLILRFSHGLKPLKATENNGLQEWRSSGRILFNLHSLFQSVKNSWGDFRTFLSLLNNTQVGGRGINRQTTKVLAMWHPLLSRGPGPCPLPRAQRPGVLAPPPRSSRNCSPETPAPGTPASLPSPVVQSGGRKTLLQLSSECSPGYLLVAGEGLKFQTKGIWIRHWYFTFSRAWNKQQTNKSSAFFSVQTLREGKSARSARRPPSPSPSLCSPSLRPSTFSATARLPSPPRPLTWLPSYPGHDSHLWPVPGHQGFGLLRTNHKWAFIQATPDSLIRTDLSMPNFRLISSRLPRLRATPSVVGGNVVLPYALWLAVSHRPLAGLNFDWIAALPNSRPPKHAHLIVNHTILNPLDHWSG
jgi:hypothetical protein